MIETTNSNLSKTLYTLVIGQLMFDGYKKAVRALLSDLQWKKRETEIEGSDALSELVAASLPRSGRKRRRKDSPSQDIEGPVKESDSYETKERAVIEAEESLIVPEEKKQGRFTCSECPKEFSRKITYQRHLKTHQTSNEKVLVVSAQKRQTSEQENTADKPNDTEEYVMTLDIKEERHNEAERDNMTEEYTEVKSAPAPEIDVSNVETPVKIRSAIQQLPKVCRICHVKFKLLKNLRDHMNNKHSEEDFLPYKCRKCEESFSNTFKRYRHECAEHDGLHPKPVKPICDFCGVTVSASALTDHIRSFHTGEKPYQCRFCDKRFVKGSHLKRHHRAHTGEKPFTCPQCNKCFADNSGLVNHQAREHSDRDENIHKCAVCCKIYRSAADLKRHEKSHVAKEDRPHQCATCGKRFTLPSILKEHYRVHTGIKPFVCQVCGKSFTQNGHLKYHLKIHNEEKPYKCDLCDSAFRCAAARRKHLATHSNKPTKEESSTESDNDALMTGKRKVETKKVIPRIIRREENSAGLQAAKGLVAMASGQGANQRPKEQIIILTSDGGPEQKQFLLTSGGQIVQQVVQQHVEPSVNPNLTNSNVLQQILRPVQNRGKSIASRGVKIAPSGAKIDNSDNYRVIFVQTSQEEQFVTDGSHGDRLVVESSQSEKDAQNSSIVTQPDIHVTSIGEQVVSQQPEGQQYEVVMETDQQTEVYQPGEVVSLDVDGSHVLHTGESEQLVEEQIVGSEASVVTSVQWT